MVIFEVCAYLFEFKEGDPPQADLWLKFELDAEIGQKVPFFKGLKL